MVPPGGDAREDREAQLNLYFVLSEQLTTSMKRDRDGSPIGPPEDYCICDVVVARSRSQAEYLAWQADPDARGIDMRDKPRFRTRLKRKGVDGPARIASDEFSQYSDERDPEIDWLWHLGPREAFEKERREYEQPEF